MAFGGSIEKQFDEAISNVLKLFTTAYVRAIPPFFNGIVAGPLREAGNQWVYEKLQSLNSSSCPLDVLPQRPPIPKDSVVLANNSLVQLVAWVNDDVLRGHEGLNTFADELTGSTGSYHYIPSSPFTKKSGILSFADTSFFNISMTSSLFNFSTAVTSVEVNGLNTWNSFALLRPVPKDDYALNSELGIDVLNLTFSFVVEMTIFDTSFTDRFQR